MRVISVNPSQEVFALFYAIMWGTLANVWPRWRAFDWARIGSPGEHTVPRCALSVFMLNVLPILFFVVVFMELSNWTLDGWWRTIGKLIVIMIQPFALVGFYWIWCSILERFRASFYPAKLDPAIFPLKPTDLDRKFALNNLIAGLAYVLIPTIILTITGSTR